MSLDNSANYQDEVTKSVQQMVEKHLKLIDSVVESDDINRIRAAHITIDGTYQACVKNWMMGLYGFHPEHGFIYDNLDIESMKDNLMVMRPKLIAYKMGLNANPSDATGKTNVSVVVENNISLDVSFENARQKMEDMPGLTLKETEEIKNKIDELQQISQEKTSDKRKWERIRPIIVFALDKGFDVAITIMGLVLQMKLGI